MRFGPIDKLDDSKYLGRPYEEVVSEIKKNNSVVHAVSDDAMVTMDFRMDRIRVRYDNKTGFVTSVRRG